jgi:hypothetical protein
MKHLKSLIEALRPEVADSTYLSRHDKLLKSERLRVAGALKDAITTGRVNTPKSVDDPEFEKLIGIALDMDLDFSLNHALSSDKYNDTGQDRKLEWIKDIITKDVMGITSAYPTKSAKVDSVKLTLVAKDGTKAEGNRWELWSITLPDHTVRMVKEIPGIDWKYETTNFIELEVDDFNRVHFRGRSKVPVNIEGYPVMGTGDGLSPHLKGLGVAQAAYKELCRIKGFISTSQKSTVSIQRVWHNLVQDPDMWSAVSSSRAIIFWKKTFNSAMESVLKMFLTEHHTFGDKFVISDDLKKRMTVWYRVWSWYRRWSRSIKDQGYYITNRERLAKESEKGVEKGWETSESVFRTPGINIDRVNNGWQTVVVWVTPEQALGMISHIRLIDGPNGVDKVVITVFMVADGRVLEYTEEMMQSKGWTRFEPSGDRKLQVLEVVGKRSSYPIPKY